MPARAIPISAAAEYVGCKNARQFWREVQEGKWPKPLPLSSRPKRWDVKALDAALDRMSGLNAPSPAENPLDSAMGLTHGEGHHAVR